MSHPVNEMYLGVTKDVARLLGGIITRGAVLPEESVPCGVATKVADVTEVQHQVRELRSPSLELLDR